MAEPLFWLSAAIILYTYLGFPLLAFLRSRFRRRIHQRADITPTVTLITVAHNEVGVIRRKLENLLALDYPRGRLSIVIASDGSDDGTNEIVREYEPKGIHFLALPRLGKMPSLNLAKSSATGEILVFSDANSMFRRDAVRVLVRSFADPSVGGVAGNQSYTPGVLESGVASGERAYWNFDQLLKEWLSDVGSVTSATGAIYAVRRELTGPVPGGVCDDAVISYRVVARGYRMVFERSAVAYEEPSSSSGAEFQRKVRISAQGLRSVMAVPQLLNPFRYGFYSVQLVSHKVLRRLMAWPLMSLLFLSLWLQSVNALYRVAAVAQLMFYGFALAGFLTREWKVGSAKLRKALTLPFYFCLANAACLLAQWRVIRGQQIVSWSARRGESAS